MRTAAILVAVLAACHSALAEPQGGTRALALVRAGSEKGVEKQLGVRTLDDLPLYEIDEAIDDQSGTFAGRLRLTFSNTTGAPVAALPLRLVANAPVELGAKPEESGAIEVTGAEAELGPAVTLEPVRATLVRLRFAQPLAAGAKARVIVRYRGKLRVLSADVNDVFAQSIGSLGGLTGTGVTDYGLLASGDGLLTLAAAYPALAPLGAAGFDEAAPGPLGDLAYNGVARFRVKTAVPAGLRIRSNLVDAASGGEKGTTVYVSEGDLVRDFVLVAARDLEERAVDVNGVRVTSVHRARDARAGQLALEVAAAALASYERRFGPYPYRELDVVESSLTGGAGGVEFSGLVLIAGMLYRSAADSTHPLGLLFQIWGGLAGELGAISGEEGGAASGMGEITDLQLDFTVAHEVAHQYFAGLVGNDTRRHPSLDEPLAQYAAGLALADRQGPEAARRATDLSVKANYAVYRLLGGPDKPVLRDLSTFSSTAEYAGLVYGKAPYLYNALEKRLGAERLAKALRAGVERHRFQIISVEQWIAALEQASGDKELRPLFRRWLEETHGDADLGVDGNGDFLIDVMLGPEAAAALREGLAPLGMRPGDLFRLLLGGGGLLGGGDVGLPGLDPEDMLEQLLGE